MVMVNVNVNVNVVNVNVNVNVNVIFVVWEGSVRNYAYDLAFLSSPSLF